MGTVKRIQILDCYPDRAQFLLGQDVCILLELSDWEDGAQIQVVLASLGEAIEQKHLVEARKKDNGVWIAEAVFHQLACGGYGVDASVLDENTVVSTAFDVVEKQSNDIRYGFLSDFAKEDEGNFSDVELANKLHLNALQFYDWMWKHEELVADTAYYQDPLGREMSLIAICEKIKECKRYGIRPFAYGAVYAASHSLFEQHPDWALYKLDGEPMSFADWLIYMDTSKGSPWSGHIVEQYAKAVQKLGFQGIHMDTYGFPKNVWDYHNNKVALADTFPDLINRSQEAVTTLDQDAGVIFNAVNNWPVESIATSAQDAVYIEVWPPHDTYRDLYTLIREAKYMAKKPVLLAAYMKPFAHAETEQAIAAAENALLLTYAVISASGGHQLIFGEHNGVLCDSYYVKYATMRDCFVPYARTYCDFVVRYSQLLYNDTGMDISMTAAGGINEDIFFTTKQGNVGFSSCGEAEKVWTLIRESERYLVLQLINLVGIDTKWNEAKPTRPTKLENIQIEILMDRAVQSVYIASPDGLDCRAVPLDYSIEQRKNGQYIVANVPTLTIWNLIWVEIL